MEARKRILSISILTLILIVPAALAVGPNAEFKAGANGFQLVPDASFGTVGFKLSVAGPSDFSWSKTFDAGSLPYFNAAGLADGAYKYELNAIPGKAMRLERPDNSPKTGSVISGAFTVRGGAMVDSKRSESFMKDQQILDDLIVDGSACIGFDCVNGESFGFDTLRLKENNLRIKAQDTSSSASFPTNDWQITFNDTSNGGANKFSIDDIDGGRTPFTIEAGAPSHSLYVEDGGRLGLGTSTPVVDIHVKSGNTPTLRLEQDGTSGFTPQTWDLAGNEANLFLRDATSGSTLPFRLFPGAPSNALTIEGTTGDIGMGTTSPTRELHILDSDATEVRVESSGAATAGIQFANTAETWNVFNNSAGNLNISRAGTGVILAIDPAGLTPGGLAGTPLCVGTGGELCQCNSCN